jgi:hypothetical protein
MMYVCILHINNTKNRTHTESFMDGWFWTSAMSLQVFQEKKQTKGRRRRQIQATRHRETEREGNTKQTNKESLPQERK